MRNLFVVDQGLSLDDVVDIIYGQLSTPIGIDADSAGIGSLYSSTLDGSIWKKVLSGTGVDKWVDFSSSQPPITIANITTPTVIDTVGLLETHHYVWAITAFSVVSPNVRYSCIISATHDGTELAAPTNVFYEKHAVIKSNGMPTDFDIFVDYDMTVDGMMKLTASSTDPVTVTATRMLTGAAQSMIGRVLSANYNKKTLYSSFDGVVTPTVGTSKWFPAFPVTMSEVFLTVDTVATSDIVFDIRKGTLGGGAPVSIFGATKPTLIAGEIKSDPLLINVPLTTNDYLLSDIVSGTSGTNLTAYITHIV
jgi:hypothetical protein